VVLRSFLSGENIKEDSGAGEHLDLAPVEIAYLSRNGDTTFALSILVFDMLHREVKNRLNSSSELNADSIFIASSSLPAVPDSSRRNLLTKSDCKK
jgi:hypothetical protein